MTTEDDFACVRLEDEAMPPAAIGTQWAWRPLPFEWREHYHGIFWRRSSCASPGTGTLAISWKLL